jgi:hypothetical protein
MNYLKRQGQVSGVTGPAHWKNESRRWVGVEGGDEMENKIKNID